MAAARWAAVAATEGAALTGAAGANRGRVRAAADGTAGTGRYGGYGSYGGYGYRYGGGYGGWYGGPYASFYFGAPAWWGGYAYPYYGYPAYYAPPAYYPYPVYASPAPTVYIQRPPVVAAAPPPPGHRARAPPAFERYTPVRQGTVRASIARACGSRNPSWTKSRRRLVRNPRISGVTITGYTDRLGSDSYNLTLSQHRADAVKSYLVGKGVAASRLVAVGKGKANPVVQCEEASTRAPHRVPRAESPGRDRPLHHRAPLRLSRVSGFPDRARLAARSGPFLADNSVGVPAASALS